MQLRLLKFCGKAGFGCGACMLGIIQMFAPLMHLSWLIISVAALRVTATNVISVCHCGLKLLLD